MKKVRTYEKFSDEYRLNENLFKRAWSAIVKFFIDKYKRAWLYYMVWLDKVGLLPKNKVEIYLPDGYKIDVPTDAEIKNVENTSVAENFDIDKEYENITFSLSKNLGYKTINEKIIDIESADLENLDVKQLMEEILIVYNMNIKRVERGEERTMNNAMMIYGAPGIGKTHILKQIANQKKIPLITWHLSSIDPTDFRGVPTIENIYENEIKAGNKVRDVKDERTVNKLPAVFPSSNDDGGGILFFDELNQARQIILSAALPIILEGEVEGYKLPQKWIVVAAGNRKEDLGGGGTAFQAPMTNRFAIYNFAPKLATDFIPYCIKNEFMNPDIIGFLQWKPKYFHMLDDSAGKVGLPWPSPRSWEEASRKDYDIRDRDWNKQPSRDRMVRTYAPQVGREAAVSFMAYLDLRSYYNEKDVEDVFKKGAKAKSLPDNLDQSFAAASAIGSWKKGEKLTEQELTNFFDFCRTYLDGQRGKDLEVVTPLMAHLNFIHKEIQSTPSLQKVYWDFVKKWHLKMKDLEEDVNKVVRK